MTDGLQGLRDSSRPGTRQPIGEARGQSTVDVFEFDDPNRVEVPHVRVRPPWVLEGGGGAIGAFYTGPLEITESITLTADVNWMTIGPITIAAGVEVTVEGNWVIV